MNATTQRPVFSARRNSPCPSCAGKIRKGDMIYLWTNGPDGRKPGKKQYVCETCHSFMNDEKPETNETKEEANVPEISQEIPPMPSATMSGIDFSKLEDKVSAAVKIALGSFDASELEELVYQQVEKFADSRIPNRLVIVKDGEERDAPNLRHDCFEEVLELATYGENIFLVGPSGCGKTVLAKQIAEVLGMKSGSLSCSAGMSEAQLFGRQVPAGEQGQFVYQTPEFIDCYENGGVFLLDEVDAADPNVLLVINQALANGVCPVPNRPGKTQAVKHDDFVLIAAANTWGSGADRMYCGRNELDAATMDRFRFGMVEIDYCVELEKRLCPDDELLSRLHSYRANIRDKKVKRLLSTRVIDKAYQWKQRGWTDEKIDSKIFAGWSESEINFVKC